MEDIIESLYNCNSLNTSQKNCLQSACDTGFPASDPINFVFVACSKLGYLDASKTLIERNPNHCFLYGSALIISAEKGHYEIVLLMLNCGVKLMYLGGHPLELACKNGHYEVAKLLLERGSNINNYTLGQAAANGHSKIVKLLLDNDARSADALDSSSKNNFGGHPLELACKNGHFEVAKLLLERGSNINNYILGQAAANGHSKIVKLLLDNNARSADALDSSSANGHYYVTRILLERNKYSPFALRCALKSALEGEHFAVAKLLLDNGALSHRLSPIIYDKITRAEIPNLVYEY